MELNAPPRPTSHAAVVILLLLGAAALRFPGLERLPPALWFDEGLNGMDALGIARGGPWPLVFTGVFPREPLLVYPMALFVRLFGNETFALRLAPALIGTAAPALLFLWLRRAVSFPAALWAAIFLIGFRWHVHFSRMALRTIWTPTLACACMAALWMAFERCRAERRAPGMRWAAASGAILGLGVYAYLSWYFFAPVVVGVAVAGFYGARRAHWRSLASVFLAAAFLAAAPLWIHYLAAPEHATGRASELSLFRDGWGAGFGEMARNARDAALMFFVRGDHVPKHNIPWRPALEPIGAALFLAGLGWAIWNWRSRLAAAALLGWLVLGALPTVVSKTDSANFLRTLILTPAVAAFAGLGAAVVGEAVKRLPRLRALATVIPSLLIAASILIMASLYFGVWARMPGLKANFSGGDDDVARYVRTAGDGAPVYVPGPMAQGSWTFRFLTAGTPGVQSYASVEELPSASHAPFVVIEFDPAAAAQLRQVYPGARPVEAFQTQTADGDMFIWAHAWEVGFD